MTYTEWIKKYSNENCDNAMNNLFNAFEKWLNENPTIRQQVPSRYGFQDIFRILFSNGITEG